MVYSFGDFVYTFFSNPGGWQNHFRGLRGRVEAFVVVASSSSFAFAFYSCAKMMMIVQTENLEWGSPFPSYPQAFPAGKGGEKLKWRKCIHIIQYSVEKVQKRKTGWMKKNPLMEIPLA